jgi:hypothetical protein
MVQIHCHTNLDLFNEQWPTELPALPRIGDEIESMISHNDFRLSLMVTGVRWRYIDNGIDYEYIPYIELHDYRQRSIKEFYEWYAPLVNKSVGYFI